MPPIHACASRVIVDVYFRHAPKPQHSGLPIELLHQSRHEDNVSTLCGTPARLLFSSRSTYLLIRIHVNLILSSPPTVRWKIEGLVQNPTQLLDYSTPTLHSHPELPRHAPSSFAIAILLPRRD